MAQRREQPESDRRVVVVSKRGRFQVCERLFERGPQLPLGKDHRIRAGRMALVEIARGKAKPLRDLGSPKLARDVVDALVLDRGLRPTFPKRLEGGAREAAAAAKRDSAKRRDLRDLATLTVDPASARDFDDAVSASEDGDGIRLWIHIADVSAHVRPREALDAEAYRRANSTYVPGAVVPMLPEVLSGDACSLVPGADRLAVTAEVTLSAQGAPRSARFYRSVIRSDVRLDYDQLDRIFAGREQAPEPVAAPLALARRASSLLADRREGSALEVSSSEPDFSFEDGQVTGAHAVPQTEAHSLIEQLMVLTNEQVAELLERKGVPTLYRVHEQPDPDRVAQLIEQLGALDIPTPPLPGRLSPTEAAQLVAEASRLCAREAERRGHGSDAYTSLVLRSLKPAQYSDRNLGHAGLGSSAYAHFTSPIRRYPDLIAHRALLSAVGEGEEAPRAEKLPEAAVQTSERERDSMKVERDADDVCAAFLLERELFERGPGERFEGEVSGVIGAGAFIRFGGELADVYEGFLPARTLGGKERFELDATQTMLVGARGGRRLRFGDPVTVGVVGVEAPRGRVDLVPTGELAS
ncbi:MAG: RNB domain-containing ribonuclease [Solirubrobacterales bacterium]|nr:RNB domain-containing ribonuclease [Solirubrobacterales bacterium]